MAKTLKMSYDDAEVVKKNFYSAQSAFEKNKDTIPESVDGGDGTDYIVESIIKIVQDAGYVALASKLGGEKMAGAIDKIKGVDESVAQTFREMDKKVTS